MKISKGSVYQRKDSPYLWINLSVNGKRIKPINTKKPKKERKFVEEVILPSLKASILDGTIDLNKKERVIKNFSYYAEKYLKTVENTKRDGTIIVYSRYITMWNNIFANKNIKDITTLDIKDVVYKMDIKSRTIKQYLIALRGIFDEAIDDNEIKINPCGRLKLPKDTKKKIVPFDADEVDLLLQKTSGWIRNLIAVSLYTGARSGELASLKWQNIDYKKKRILIDSSYSNDTGKDGPTKTGYERYVPIFDELVQYLKDQEVKTGLKEFVFYSPEGKRLNMDNVRQNYWTPLLRRLKLRHRTPYQTRHTFATNLLNSKKFTINQVAKLLGHTSIKMLVETYNNFLEDEFNRDDFCYDFCYDKLRSA